MFGTGELEGQPSTEPLLANETVPLEFLASPDDGRPKSKVVGPLLGVIMGALLVGAVILGIKGTAPGWHPLLEPFVEFVESERGLEFSSPVALLDTDVGDYVPRNVGRFTATRRLPDLERAFFILGVENFDPAETAANGPLEEIWFLRTEEAIAESHYIIETGQILLRRDVPEEALQLNIVHELTRALQHQNGMVPPDFGDIPVFGQFDESDGQRLFDALVEGDATRIERAYYDQMTNGERAAYHQASGTVLEGVRNPETQSDRYTIGAAFTSWIVERDGVHSLNQMMRQGEHGSTDQFVDVLGSFEQVVNAKAEANLPETNLGPLDGFGAFGWFVALAPHVGTADAFDAVIGYDNDAFVVLNNPNVQRTSPQRTCIHSEVFFDSTTDATEFANIIIQLDVQIEAEVFTERRSVRVDLCEPLNSPNEQSAAASIPLIVANELAAHHLRNGEPVAVARCAAIEQAKTIAPDLSFDGFTGYNAYIDDAEAFIGGCN